MKNFLLVTVAMMSLTVNAAIVQNKQHIVLSYQEVRYKKIEANQISSQVLKTASARYSGYALNEAFVSDSGDYKLVLKKNDKVVVAYYKSTGEFIKEEAK